MVELLIVITIIAVMASAVIVIVKPDSLGKVMQTEAQRLSATLSLAADEAIFQGDEMGVVPFRNGYQFYVWDQPDPLDLPDNKGSDLSSQNQDGQVADVVNVAKAEPEPGQWRLLKERPFKPYRLPEGLNMHVEIEGEALILDQMEVDQMDEGLNDELNEDESDDVSEEAVPPLLLLSSGEMTPFTLELHSDHRRSDHARALVYTIKGNLLGAISLLRPGEKAAR